MSGQITFSFHKKFFHSCFLVSAEILKALNSFVLVHRKHRKQKKITVDLIRKKTDYFYLCV